jgi:hypothetical protein
MTATTEFINITAEDPVVKHFIETSDKAWTIKEVELKAPAIILDPRAPRKTLRFKLVDPAGKEHEAEFNYLKAKRKLEDL